MIHRPLRRSPLRRPASAASVLGLAVASLMMIVVGCSKSGPKPVASPGIIYKGPEHLRGTVGSMVSLDGYEPMLVSGFGVVMGLDGTGSAEVPAFLRQWMITELGRDGFGSARSGLQALTPERLLADPSTTIVAIQGFIPPGAVKGKRFDVLVSALDAQTTSLAGGTLWISKLRVGGTDPNLKFTFTQALAQGPIFVSPDDPTHGRTGGSVATGDAPQAMIASGAAVTQTRPLTLGLHSPSYARARGVADRINERYPATQRDKRPTAVAESDQIIRLNIPAAYAADPAELLDLIAHTYVYRVPGFEEQKSTQLAELLMQRPELSKDIQLSWRALGKRAVTSFRSLYDHPDARVRLTALEAGAYLGDERASEALSELADHPDLKVRQRVAEALVHLPSSLRGAAALRRLLDDPAREVRIAAYQSLASNHDPLVDRVPVRGVHGLKYVIDRVSSERPMVLITQEDYPRLVLFGPQLGFDSSTLGSVWNGRLMVREDRVASPQEGEPGQRFLTLFYQRPQGGEPIRHKLVPTVATLAFVLGHRSTSEVPQEGLNLSYAQVVDAIYTMCKSGSIPAEVVVQRSELAERISQFKEARAIEARPESGSGTQIAGGGLTPPGDGRVITQLPVVGTPPPGGPYQPAALPQSTAAPSDASRPLIGLPNDTSPTSTPTSSPTSSPFDLEPFDWNPAPGPADDDAPATPTRPESGDPIALPPSEANPIDPFANEYQAADDVF